MAAQVVPEAAGGGDGAGGAVDGLGGGAGRGSLHAGYGRDGVGDQIAGRLDDAGAGGTCTWNSSGSMGSVLMSSGFDQTASVSSV